MRSRIPEESDATIDALVRRAQRMLWFDGDGGMGFEGVDLFPAALKTGRT